MIKELKYTNQVKHYAHKHLTTCQMMPSQFPWPALSPAFPPSLCIEDDAICIGIFLGPAWVSCPDCVPSWLLVPPNLLADKA